MSLFENPFLYAGALVGFLFWALVGYAVWVLRGTSQKARRAEQDTFLVQRSPEEQELDAMIACTLLCGDPYPIGPLFNSDEVIKIAKDAQAGMQSGVIGGHDVKWCSSCGGRVK